MKQIRIEMEDKLHTLLKQKCLERGISMRQLVKDTFAEYLDGEYIGGNFYVYLSEDEYNLLKQRCEELGGIDKSEFISRVIRSDELLKAVVRDMYPRD